MDKKAAKRPFFIAAAVLFPFKCGNFARSKGIFICSGLEHRRCRAYTTPPLRISGLAFGPAQRVHIELAWMG